MLALLFRGVKIARFVAQKGSSRFLVIEERVMP